MAVGFQGAALPVHALRFCSPASCHSSFVVDSDESGYSFVMEAGHLWVLKIGLSKETPSPPGEAVCLLQHHLVDHILSETLSFMVHEGCTDHSSLKAGDRCKEPGII